MDKDIIIIPKKRKKNAEKSEKSNRGEKTIRIWFDESGQTYSELVSDFLGYRKYIDGYFAAHSEVFPLGFELGYNLHDKRSMKKIEGLIIRRIKLKNGEVYEIVPSNIMPYMSGKTEDIWQGLWLRKWAVPYEVIATLFGRDAMYWERLEMSLGRGSLVGSLCKKGNLPVHLAADEKISRWNGSECYIAMTSSKDCMLGAEISMSEDTVGLEAAYGVFKAEAQACEPTYSPESVNLDGWKATNAAWGNLFPQITLILCFLHSFLKIRDISKHLKEQFKDICTQVWDVYRKETKQEFMEAIATLETWASTNLAGFERVLLKINDLCAKSARFATAYDFPDAYRTSNQIDRPMNALDRYLYQIRYFSGNRDSANQKIRAWAMMYNFAPFSQRVQKRKINPKKDSRFQEFNGFVYHANWLQNCLIANSLNGTKCHHTIR